MRPRYVVIAFAVALGALDFAAAPAARALCSWYESAVQKTVREMLDAGQQSADQLRKKSGYGQSILLYAHPRMEKDFAPLFPPLLERFVAQASDAQAAAWSRESSGCRHAACEKDEERTYFDRVGRCLTQQLATTETPDGGAPTYAVVPAKATLTFKPLPAPPAPAPILSVRPTGKPAAPKPAVRKLDQATRTELAKIDARLDEIERLLSVHRGRLGEWAGDRHKPRMVMDPRSPGSRVWKEGERTASTELRLQDADFEVRKLEREKEALVDKRTRVIESAIRWERFEP